MITKEQAMSLQHGAVLYSTVMKGSDKRPVRVRVNGRCLTWKTRPEEFKLPVKYGMRDCFYVTHLEASGWHRDEEGAARIREERLRNFAMEKEAQP